MNRSALVKLAVAVSLFLTVFAGCAGSVPPEEDPYLKTEVVAAYEYICLEPEEIVETPPEAVEPPPEVGESPPVGHQHPGIVGESPPADDAPLFPYGESPPLSEPEPAPLYITDGRIDIRYFLLGHECGTLTYGGGAILDEVQHLLGEQISHRRAGEMSHIHNFHEFESGVTAGTSWGKIFYISVDFSLAESPFVFHLGGIDGNSTRDDVVALFGTPFSRGNLSSSYSYGNNHVAIFWFDENGNVVSIEFLDPI